MEAQAAVEVAPAPDGGHAGEDRGVLVLHQDEVWLWGRNGGGESFEPEGVLAGDVDGAAGEGLRPVGVGGVVVGVRDDDGGEAAEGVYLYGMTGSIGDVGGRTDRSERERGHEETELGQTYLVDGFLIKERDQIP